MSDDLKTRPGVLDAAVIISDSATSLDEPPAPTISAASSSARAVPSAVYRSHFPRRFVLLALGTALLTAAQDASSLMPDTPYSGFLGPAAALASAAGLACLVTAAVATGVPTWLTRWYARLRLVALATAYTLTFDALVLFLLAMYTVCFLPVATTYTEVIAFTQVNADVALSGGNPYTDDALFVPTLRHYRFVLATPLRRGAFGTSDDYPATQFIVAIQRKYLANPTRYAASFDPATLHSYPALSFLLYVPLLALGLRNILVLHLLLFLAGIIVLARLAPPGMRRWSALLAFSDVLLLGHSLLIETEIVCLAFLLVAWHFRKRLWFSALLLGLACAFKQYCWLFAPFFLLDTFRREGYRGAARFIAIAATAFILPNLPYFLMDPSAWMHSVLLPATDPLFPQGIGIGDISAAHLLPFAPQPVYTAMELLAYAGALWCQWRWADRLGDVVLLLALVPLYFAFRSLPNYFAVAPWLALYALNMRSRRAGTVRVEASSAISFATSGPG